MKARIALALVMALSVGACVADSSVADDSADSTPRLASNGMLPTAIVPTTIYAAPLTGVALTNSGLEATSSGRSYLTYIIDCALSGTQTIRSTYGLTQYSYPGNIGIAPAWTTRALTAQEGNWISACVLERANYFGTSVTISMRGDAGIWGTTTDEAANYNVEEGAFYGNIWNTSGGMHACNGVDQVRDGDTYGDLPLRQCAQPDPNNPGFTPCGFVFDGNCADICTLSTSGDHYSSCRGNTYVLTSRLYGTAP